MNMTNNNPCRKTTLGKPVYNVLITKANIRKQMKELDKTLISDKLKIKGENLTYNRVHRFIYRIYRDVIINFDDRLKRLVTIFNWI
jgi:hypothetical protein